jgi:hypothetical protein
VCREGFISSIVIKCGKLSDSFETTCGLRQGGALSTLLFNIMLEKVIHNI